MTRNKNQKNNENKTAKPQHGKIQRTQYPPYTWMSVLTASVYDARVRDGAVVVNYKTPWPESGSELYRPGDSRLSTNLMPTFVDRECHLVRVTHPYGCILSFVDWSCYFFFQVAPQLYSRGWADPVPGPLLVRKFGSAGNRIWICSQEIWPLDHRGGLLSSS
jgi:hypothetical protein